MGLQIQIGADVDGAVSGLNRVNTSLTALPGKLNHLRTSSNSANLAMVNMGRIVQDLPYGFLGIANNLNPLLESFQRLKKESGSTGTALKALFASFAGVGGVGIVLSFLTFFGIKAAMAKRETEDLNKTVDEAKKKQEDFSAALERAASSVTNQTGKLDDLKNILISASSAVDGLSDSLIRQAFAQFILDKKNVEIQKILTAEIQKRIQARQKESMAANIPEFNFQQFSKNPLDKQIGEARGQLGILNALGADVVDIINEIIGKRNKIEIPIKFHAGKADGQEVVKEIKESVETAFDNASGGVGRGEGAGLRIKIGPEIGVDGSGLQERIQKELDRIGSVLRSGFEELVGGIGEDIGNLLSGKGFGKEIFQIMGSLISQIGKALVSYGIVKTELDKVLAAGFALPGAVAIGAGLTAIALGQLVKNSQIKARAMGGLVNAGEPYWVGERGPELYVPSNAGKIIPNHSLNGITGSARQMITVNGEFEIDGRKLKLVLARQNGYDGRNV